MSISGSLDCRLIEPQEGVSHHEVSLVHPLVRVVSHQRPAARAHGSDETLSAAFAVVGVNRVSRQPKGDSMARETTYVVQAFNAGKGGFTPMPRKLRNDS